MKTKKGFTNVYEEYCSLVDDIIIKDYEGNIEGNKIYHGILDKYINKIDKKIVKILEIGCGTGKTICYLAKKHSKIDALGIDILPEAISASERTARLMKCEKITKFSLCDANHTPFSDESFNLIFSQGTMEHFRNITGIMGEQKRLLKKDGFLIINVPQTYCYHTIKKKIKMMTNNWKPGWETQYSLGDLKKIAEKYNLQLLEVKGQIYDTKLSELIKAYNKIIPKIAGYLHKRIRKVWDKIVDKKGHLFLVEIIGIYQKKSVK